MNELDWQKEFPLTSITREDIRKARFSVAQIALLTDADMHHLAAQMEDLYLDHGFWEDLEQVVSIMLAEKEQPHGNKPMPQES